MAYHKSNSSLAIPLALLKAVTLGWLITIAGTCLMAFLLNSELLDEKMIKPAAVIIMVISAFLTAIAGGKRAENKLMMCLAGGAFYYASLLGCNALFFAGKYNGMLGALLAVAGCALTAALLLSRQKQQRPAYMKTLRKG